MHRQAPTPPSRTRRTDAPAVSEIAAFTISSPTIEVEVWNHGARLVGVTAPDRSGDRTNVVLRHESMAEYLGPNHHYFGATIGRYANRIAGSSIALGNGVVSLEPNEGSHQLHGGPVGFDRHIWDVQAATRRAVTLRHTSPDGDQGFLGTVTADVTYAVDGPELHIETTARTDVDTVFGTTNHAYWNLAGTGTIGDHILKTSATRYVDVDTELIPTGVLRELSDGPIDLSNPVELAEVIAAGGVDHCFVFEGDADAILSHPPSGRTLTIRSKQPGLQFYTGQYLPMPFAGVCLEPQQLPDTPNRRNFGSSLLKAGSTYRHVASYTFGVME